MKLLAFVLLAAAAFAQDERRVTSPNGQIEFRVFIAVQQSNRLPRLAYEVYDHGKPLITTSFMGIDIEVQEPLLGENVGLTSSSMAKSDSYNALLAKYMQNGSLGRLINIEARAFNDGVAFRYVIPESTPLRDFRVMEEATEFKQAPGASVEITESNPGVFPPMHVDQSLSRLEHSFQATTPLTSPWRIISVGKKITP